MNFHCNTLNNDGSVLTYPVPCYVSAQEQDEETLQDEICKVSIKLHFLALQTFVEGTDDLSG